MSVPDRVAPGSGRIRPAHDYRRSIEPRHDTPEYLSDEWFVAADRILRADAGLRERSRGVRLVVQQTVTDDDRATVWHIVLADGEVSLHVGPAERTDVAFSCDRATAEAVRNGECTAPNAFISGRLRIEGTAEVLLEHAAVFVDLDDVLAPLR